MISLDIFQKHWKLIFLNDLKYLFINSKILNFLVETNFHKNDQRKSILTMKREFLIHNYVKFSENHDQLEND
jgi:hypothetical protein